MTTSDVRPEPSAEFVLGQATVVMPGFLVNGADALPDRAFSTFDRSHQEPEEEIDRLTLALASKFEELSLIHQLSDRLKLGEDCDQICRSLLDELELCIDANVIAIDLDADEDFQFEGQFLQSGQRCDVDWLRRIASHALEMVEQSRGDSGLGIRAAIWNHPNPGAPAAVRAVVVPIERHAKCLGRMIAIRSLEAEEFGTIEADLMKSTSMMLGSSLDQSATVSRNPADVRGNDPVVGIGIGCERHLHLRSQFAAWLTWR